MRIAGASNSPMRNQKCIRRGSTMAVGFKTKQDKELAPLLLALLVKVTRINGVGERATPCAKLCKKGLSHTEWKALGTFV